MSREVSSARRWAQAQSPKELVSHTCLQRRRNVQPLQSGHRVWAARNAFYVALHSLSTRFVVRATNGTHETHSGQPALGAKSTREFAAIGGISGRIRAELESTCAESGPLARDVSGRASFCGHRLLTGCPFAERAAFIGQP